MRRLEEIVSDVVAEGAVGYLYGSKICAGVFFPCQSIEKGVCLQWALRVGKS